MKQLAHCSVEKFEEPATEGTYIPLIAEPGFSEVLAFAKAQGICNLPLEPTSYFPVSAHPDDPRLQLFFDLLKRHGWNVTHRFVPRASRANQFGYWIARSYDEADLDGAELLYLMNWRHLTDFAGRDGERWIGDAEYVGADTDLGWEQQMGTIGQQSFFVNSQVKQQMTDGDIRGLKFHSLRWNRPNDAKGEFWELDSDFEMPSCLLPVVNMDGPLAYEEDRPYSPVELQFRRSEVDAMGQFDIAWTREEIGDMRRQDWGRHWLVVSQKFRQFFRSINLPINYGIARLVD